MFEFIKLLKQIHILHVIWRHCWKIAFHFIYTCIFICLCLAYQKKNIFDARGFLAKFTGILWRISWKGRKWSLQLFLRTVLICIILVLESSENYASINCAVQSLICLSSKACKRSWPLMRNKLRWTVGCIPPCTASIDSGKNKHHSCH